MNILQSNDSAGWMYSEIATGFIYLKDLLVRAKIPPQA